VEGELNGCRLSFFINHLKLIVMKAKLLSLVAIFLMGTMASFAQTELKPIEVKGNCGMCEKRIEKAANSIEGVTDAQWNKDTKMLAFSLDADKANMEQIHKAVAAAGHDTKKMKATDEVYNKLPGCCQYDRSETLPQKELKDHESH
jgi:copper chaperone CopZ